MTEHTGQRQADTDDGETPTATAAWAEYAEHQRGCPQCQTSVWRCPDGNSLWNGYLRVAS